MRIPLRSKKIEPYPDTLGGQDADSYRHEGKLYTTSEEYYRVVVKSLPIDPNDPRGEVITDASYHTDVCERLARGGAYAVSFNTPDPDMYVDNWSISDPSLYHRHPELRILGTRHIIGAHMEWDVLDNRCTMCDKQIPGEIWMMWKLEQL